jgi:hypothetical protein
MRIIDNKKIDITDREYDEYIKICRSYDRPNFKGEELFRGLIQTDNNGQIVYIKPPSDRYTSFEAISFAFYLLNTQGLRAMQKQVDAMLKDAKEKVATVIAEAKAANLK